MKIAIVSSTFLPAQEGVSITLFERLQQLDRDGHSVLCFVSSYREVGYLYPHNIPCIASYRTNFVDYLSDYTPWWATGMSKLLVRQLTRWVYNINL